jgi:rsbT co-antagonist protein RsbR
MGKNSKSRIPEVLKKFGKELLADWVKEQLNAIVLRRGLIKEPELLQQSADFLALLQEVTQSGNVNDITAPEWTSLREMLGTISRSRTVQGFTSSETATFVLSFKQPLFTRLRDEIGKDAETLFDEVWTANILLDKLGLYTTEVYQKGREEIIGRQKMELLELSTPVVKLWDGILALPLIGILDSARTQIVMESLLQRIVETGSSVAIIDITGVPTVDTLVAQHLLKTVAAARLMGADCIISGIRPQIAQTIVHLGVTLGDVVTKSTLADAFMVALQRIGLTVKKNS